MRRSSTGRKKRKNSECWDPRYDETIMIQAMTYLDILNGKTPNFVPRQPEDYPFARIFGWTTEKEGKQRWPSLCEHESNRIREVKKEKYNLMHGKEIESKDHRVIQALAMAGKVKKLNVKIKHPEAVNKSWPQFWKFLNDSPNL